MFGDNIMTKEVKIAPSVLSADFSRLGEEVCRVSEAGADLIHLDVMDGHFVPNLTMGPEIIKSIRKLTTCPFDVHLMMTHPQSFIDAFADAGADFITFHIESDSLIEEVIHRIKSHGLKTGIALRPETPISAVLPYLQDIDLVLPMSVEPGFSGQKFIMNTLNKMDALSERICALSCDVEIQVDGGITPETGALAVNHNATILVAGTAIFDSHNLSGTIQTLRNGTG